MLSLYYYNGKLTISKNKLITIFNPFACHGRSEKTKQYLFHNLFLFT